MNTFLLGIFLLTLVSCDQNQVVLTPNTNGQELIDNESSESEPEIVKIIRITRHGTTAGYFALYPGEWSPYNLQDPEAQVELELSALGMGQCWSSGASLAIKYQSFVEEAIQEESFEMNIGPKKKTVTCATKFLYGLSKKVPFIGIYTDALVAEAFEDKGNCFSCTSESAFPFEKSQLLTTRANDQDFSEKIVVHPTAFLDLDESCPKVFAFYGGDYDDDVPQQDIDYILELSGYTMDLDKIELVISSIPNTYSKHLMHHLPALDVSSKLTKMAENIMSGEGKRPFIKYISEAQSNNYAVIAVYGRNILIDIKNKIENDDKLVLYTTHNNNALALLMLIQGIPHENYRDYQINLAANVDIIVYYDSTTGSKYVNLEINGNLKEITGCGTDCPYDEFLKLVESKLELGGDLKVFCNE